jgi:hypothetical protein
VEEQEEGCVMRGRKDEGVVPKEKTKGTRTGSQQQRKNKAHINVPGGLQHAFEVVIHGG